MLTKKITPCLLFSGQAKEAAEYYVSIFKKSKITHSTAWTTSFNIEGQDFVALDGPKTPFTWAVSFYITCKTQKEIDYYSAKLRAGGGEQQPCGWVKVKFGLSWQITPEMMPKLLAAKDKEKVGRLMEAMMEMKKLDIAKLKRAFAGKGK